MLKETEICPDCETVLAHRDGDTILRFTAHDPQFCKLGMKILIKSLRNGISMANERVSYTEAKLLRQMEDRKKYNERLEMIADMLSGRCHGKMVYNIERERWDCPECGRWTNHEKDRHRAHAVPWKDPDSIKLVRDRLVEFLDGVRR